MPIKTSGHLIPTGKGLFGREMVALVIISLMSCYIAELLNCTETWMETEGEVVPSLVTGVSPKVLSSGMGEKGAKEAAAQDRNFSSMVPSLWLPSLHLVCWCGWERGLRKDFPAGNAGLCAGGRNGVQQECEQGGIALPNYPLGPEIAFQSQKHCWGYELAACSISLLSGCLGYKLLLFLP